MSTTATPINNPGILLEQVKPYKSIPKVQSSEIKVKQERLYGPKAVSLQLQMSPLPPHSFFSFCSTITLVMNLVDLNFPNR
ncbi:hypothetical protein X798_03159 [Onchocerca flexuosa]|uniref:ZM domain-containing protein n=2 Tax=Onchocerca flexuosa TaxID=387005 RepID=A0A183H1W8_9BILA|nr:hypothetical protein X798_03159 [Onchocerca flexuosa]VDO29696.1 unnamed protein product [Onchocerca flexuosa]